MSSLTDLTAAIGTATNAIKDATLRKALAAYLADNAIAFNGMNSEQMLAAATSGIAAHMADSNNPHHTTADQLGAYTKAAVDQLIATLLPAGIVPVSRFGDLSTTDISYTSDGGINLTISQTPVIMAGNYYLMPTSTVPVYPNGPSYIYLQLQAGVATYAVSNVPLVETNGRMMVGRTTAANGSIQTALVEKVTRIDKYRISTTSAGSAIPVSLGDPASPGSLAWK